MFLVSDQICDTWELDFSVPTSIITSWSWTKSLRCWRRRSNVRKADFTRKRERSPIERSRHCFKRTLFGAYLQFVIVSVAESTDVPFTLNWWNAVVGTKAGIWDMRAKCWVFRIGFVKTSKVFNLLLIWLEKCPDTRNLFRSILV